MTNRTSKAAVMRQFGNLSIEDVPLPAKIERGALLVKVDRASVCGTDVHCWEGVMSRGPDLPVILGHEMVGEIVEFGEDAARDSFGAPLAPGDRIVWTHSSCSRCYYCTELRQPVYCQNRRRYMYENINPEPHLLGGFSQYSYVLPGSERVKVPGEVSSDMASMASCAFRSVIHAFDLAGRLDPSWTVVIQGSGALGLLATYLAKRCGVRRVLTIGDPASRLRLAADLGADTVLSVSDSTKDDRLAMVRSLTSGRGADVVFEFTGATEAVAEGLTLARKAGRYVLVGQLHSAEARIDASLITLNGLQVLGSYSGSIEHYRRALDEVNSAGKASPLARILGRTYTLEKVEDALRGVQNLSELKPIIRPWS